jgi:hypothetical protein
MIANPDQQDDNLCPECRDDLEKIRESHARTFNSKKRGATMTTKHTPGKWDVQNKGTLGTRSARHEVVAGTNVDGSKNLPTICRMPDLSARSYANARLIAACPTMYEFIRSRAEKGDAEAKKTLDALHLVD